jgi:hypothetical protein
MTEVDKVKRNIRINSLITGLTAIDPEHKQFILEELLRDEMTKEEFEDTKARERWAAPKYPTL